MNERCRFPITTLHSALTRVAFLLAFIIVAHQFVMATPAHEAIMPITGHNMQASVPMPDSHNCPCCPVHTTAICAAVQAALPIGTSAILLVVAALVATTFFVRDIRPGVIATADWRPPPRHTLVLFQTFRC